MPSAQRIRNIGIFAHVDAGKTTLSERILTHSGTIRNPGSVDAGTAHTDNLEVEQRRGISVRATCVSFDWKGATFNLIDTPGHADFSSEIERSIWPLDGAILLVDAADGVQPQTEVLYQALKAANVPLLAFLNKCDREGASPTNVLTQIRSMLTTDAVFLSEQSAIAEMVCGNDEDLMEAYLDGRDIPQETIRHALAELIRRGDCMPVLCGSALKDEGVTELLDAVVDYLPPPQTGNGDLCALVFASYMDRTMGRALSVRVFSGRLENRMEVALKAKTDGSHAASRKITQIHDVKGGDLGVLEAGMVGVVFGLGELPVGYVFGNPELLPRKPTSGALREPLINVQVLPEKQEEMHALHSACMQLSAEDPMLKVTYVRSLNQLQMNLMGTVQLEILEEILAQRFGLKAHFSEPSVIYKETVRSTATGYIAYTMPKPCWAIMTFHVEPAPRGSGVTFSSQVPLKDIMARYQHQVEETIPRALAQGRLGWEVTDVKITLLSGGHHLEHTHPLDFVVATPMGIQDALQNAGSVLLEPILEAQFVLPTECVGRVISDVNTMRGEVLDTESRGGRVLLKALLPVSSSLNYPTTLAMLTGGKGAMNVRLHSYRDCPLELGKTAPRRTVDPLDKARYILVVRNAISEDLFEE
ncbi:MAG: TetM/TetW/TetO/TetS family tetracycline resistance ribosomal protection protein [Lentisphaeria bacterium]|nr:TetM/TetW/TetO/TetS family tetracycline resistance ribosomal protection protein [Lentisphaeria bacterium]